MVFTIRKLAISVVATSGVFATACAPAREPARVTVQNMTSEPIMDLSVEVSNEQLRAVDLQRGSSVELDYSIGVESDYHVIAKLASGKVIEGRVGYVDGGLNDHDLISIHDDGVAFRVLTTRHSASSSR